MKKYFLLALVVLTGIASSCKYDDEDLWENVNDLAERVTSLEAATKQMNSDIAAMQSIISALQNQVTVSKVEELKDGYIIHFTDGTKATIKNGADGKDGANGADGKDGVDGENGKDGKDGANAPIINVKQEGGVYYWTITVDGKTEWLTDEDGNKLRVSGEDGEDGKDGISGSSGKNGNTPLLKVNDGYWMVSYDNGTTYANVKDVNGTPVKAEGNDGEAGDSKFTSINKSGDKVVIVFDGKTYEIPLAASVTYSGTGIDGDVVTLAPKTSVTLNYELSEMLNASVEVVKAPDFVAVEAGNGKLTIKAKSAFTEPGKIVLLYYNANKTITSVLTVKVTTMVATAADLQDKLNAGGMVSLSRDVTMASTLNIAENNDVTLDLNGHNLSYVVTNTGASAIIKNQGTLNIINLGQESDVQISFVAENPDRQNIPSYATNTISNFGTLTIGENVTVINGSDGGASYAVDNHAIFTLNGGTLIGKKCALRIAKYNPPTVKFTMNDGLIKSEGTAAWIQLPGSQSNDAPSITVEINGGVMTSTTSTPDYNSLFYSYSFGNSHKNTSITINGGEFFNGWVSIGTGYYGDAPTLQINGGVFQYDVIKWTQSSYEVLYNANYNE